MMTVRPIIILLLEDDDDDYLLSMESVKSDRMLNQIYRVKDGIEGLAYLRRDPDGYADTPTDDRDKVPFSECPLPDIIIADLRMPRMDGREFVIEAKKDPKIKKIPIIVLTNSADERDIAELYDVGAAAYIVKPINIREMGRVVREIRDFYLSVVRLKGRDYA